MPHNIAESIEAEAFLAAHPDLVGVDLLLPDQHGVLRGTKPFLLLTQTLWV